MKQNIYDDPQFFAGYKQLRDADSGLNGALEQPAFQSLLPPLHDLRVLDLGCGFGDFSRLALAQGARQVVGVDISTAMLAEAQRQTDDAAVQYVRSAIEDYRPAPQAFELIASSLVLHYIEDFTGVVANAWTALVPGGRLVFSIEHPLCTAALRGWVTDAAGVRLHWPLDRYRDEGPRRSRWFVDNVLKYHRTLETYMNTLIDQGFAIRRVLEPAALPERIALRPELADESRRPPFLLIAAEKI